VRVLALPNRRSTLTAFADRRFGSLEPTKQKAPAFAEAFCLAGPTGFEPAISSVTGRRDRPLHYEPLRCVPKIGYFLIPVGRAWDTTGVILPAVSPKSNARCQRGKSDDKCPYRRIHLPCFIAPCKRRCRPGHGTIRPASARWQYAARLDRRQCLGTRWRRYR
jgi:hypothetical protein